LLFRLKKGASRWQSAVGGGVLKVVVVGEQYGVAERATGLCMHRIIPRHQLYLETKGIMSSSESEGTSSDSEVAPTLQEKKR
jgi:hypothetical protein